MKFGPLAIIFGTRRGLITFGANAIVAFGLIAGALQFVGQLFTPKVTWPWIGTGIVVLTCCAWGVIRAYPRKRVSRDFDRPEMTVEVKVGDLFDEGVHLVAGFTDTFDTDTTYNVVINKRSVQGQLLDRLYDGDKARLDAELMAALAGTDIIDKAEPTSKRAGKLDRYAVGTVAVLGSPGDRRIFAAAYSKMADNLVAKSSVNMLWQGLSAVWDAVYVHAQREPVAIPLVGSELARINCLDRESLLKMILLSFVARSREDLVCRQLTVVIHPNDFAKINMLEIAAFLKTL